MTRPLKWECDHCGCSLIDGVDEYDTYREYSREPDSGVLRRMCSSCTDLPDLVARDEEFTRIIMEGLENGNPDDN